MKDCLCTWSEFCPEFEIRRWDEDSLPSKLPYLKRAMRARQFANLSNYMRLVAVYEHGGFYLDTDIELRQSLEPLRNEKCFFGWQLEKPLDWAINNAIFAATPRHPFVGALANALLEEFNGNEHPPLSSPHLVSRMLIARGLNQFTDEISTVGDITIFPRRYFYPYSFEETFSEDCVTPDTVCVHHWSNSWAARKKRFRFFR